MMTETLKQLFVDELRDIYSAEKQLTKAMPKMISAAKAGSVRGAFEKHLEQTKDHVARLEQLFEQLHEKPSGVTCEGMQGLIKEAQRIAKKKMTDHVHDAALIGAAQKIEHYEIATYGTLIAWAKTFNGDMYIGPLEQTLNEEKETDHILTDVAKEANPAAIA